MSWDFGAELAAYAELLNDKLDRTVVLELADLNPPGYVLQATGIDVDQLAAGHYLLNARLLLVSPDTNVKRASTKLGALLAELEDAGLRPTGKVTAQTVTPTEGGGQLPALAYPLDLQITP